MKANVTIIGPRSVGKSTIAKLLSAELDKTYVEFDELMKEALEPHGGMKLIMSKEHRKLVSDTSVAVIKKAYEQENAVFDLTGGAISSAFDKNNEIIKEVIKSFSTVIMLFPFKDVEQSVSFLFEREQQRKHFLHLDKNFLLQKVREDYLKAFDALYDFSEHVLFVEHKTPEEILAEIKENFI
ncbi:MAG: hypothetical protein H6502_05515 [Candidatus Woesearchaeota archaeon]|nr:MAG: hypothetical protein H6502_05515 [Candidatus Woesearchaeota archaeon]